MKELSTDSISSPLLMSLKERNKVNKVILVELICTVQDVPACEIDLAVFRLSKLTGINQKDTGASTCLNLEEMETKQNYNSRNKFL